MNYYEMEDSMVPERDQQSGYDAGNELMDDPQAAMILKTSMAAFNQQRSVVAKLSREEIEDRYLRLLEENVALKKHAVKQEEKIKKIATKLIRVMSDKKRLELGGPPSTRGGGHRDIETEELIEDQQQRIRELERTTNQFKDRLTVAKQQMLAVQQQTQNAASSMRPRRPKTLPQSPSQAPSLLMMSPTPTTGHHHQQLLSQQAQHLLEEARNENRMLEESVNMLKEQVNMFELEVEQIQEQAKIKEANYEEEIGLLRDQVKERNYQDVAENIELIRLQQDKKNRSTQLTTVKAQISAFEEQVSNLKAEVEKLKCENADLSTNLADEQRKAISLASELASNSASKQALMEAEEKLRDVQKENAIIRESNAKLLDSAYNVERERQFVASENALKVQVAQLETTLKADLNDKKMLSDALCNEREALAKVDSDYQDLQSNYFSLKETMEGHEEKLKFFAQENSVQACDLEEALLWLRQRSAGSGQQQQKTNGVVGGGHYPEFLEAGEATNGNVMDTDAAKQLRSDLSQVQAHHVEAVNELEKTRSLLRVQANINIEQKNEIEALQQRLFHVKAEFQGQIGEYKKLLDMRASRIHKLEMQLRDNTYGLQNSLSNSMKAAENLNKSMATSVQSGQSLFEIHVQKVNLTKECVLGLGLNQPKIFATWTFYEHDMQYTPVALGPQAVLDCSAYYKVKLDDALLDFLMDSSVQVEIQLVTENKQQECKTIGLAQLKLNEVVHYPSNKLHGSVLLHGNPSASMTKEPPVIGSLDYWFKLHTAATSRIQEWLDHREEVERVLEAAAANNVDAKVVLSEVELLQGEQRRIQLPEHQEKLLGRRRKSPTPEHSPAPRIKKEPKELPPPTKLSLPKKKTPEATKAVKSPKEELKEPTKVEKEQDSPEAEEQASEASEVGVSSNADHESSTQGGETSSASIAEAKMKKPTKLLKRQDKDVQRSPTITVDAPKTKEEKKKLHPVTPLPKPRAPIQEVKTVEAAGEVKDVKKVPPAEAAVKAKSEWDSDKDEDMEEEDKKEKTEVKGAKIVVTEESDEEESEETETDEEEESEESEEDEESEEEEASTEDNKASEEAKSDSSKKEEEEEEDESSGEDGVSAPDLATANSSKRVKELQVSETTTGESSSTSHDSEGVVVRKENSIGGSRSSVASGTDCITITVSEFTAGKNANFFKNKKIQKLFVEYSFLDLKAEETETPFALPKPKAANESIVFNFSKVIPMDRQTQTARRRMLTKILSKEAAATGAEAKDGSKQSQTASIAFSLVSEPDEAEGEDGKCEDVGVATVDLEAMYKSGRDLVDAVLDVHSAEPQTRVSRFLGSKKTIGTLTVSVMASDVFKSLKL